MTDFVITTENAADLPEEFIQENEIGILSLYYTIDGVTYGPDGDRLDVEEFYAKMRAGALPKTQQVNPDQAIQKFRSYLEQGKDILHLALTSAVSGSYNSAKMAAQAPSASGDGRTARGADGGVPGAHYHRHRYPGRHPGRRNGGRQGGADAQSRQDTGRGRALGQREHPALLPVRYGG